MKEIRLTNGMVTIIDDDDYDLVSQRTWFPIPNRNITYAATFTPLLDSRLLFLHSFVLGKRGNVGTDHINGNGLDNRKENLRPASQRQNMMNRSKSPTVDGKVCSSNFKGVTWLKRRRRWQSRVKLIGRNYYLGEFKNEITAVRAYDIKAQHYFGEFAKLNLPLAKLPGC